MSELQEQIRDHSELKRRGRRDKKDWKRKGWEVGPNDCTWHEVYPGHEVEIDGHNRPTGLFRTADNMLPRFADQVVSESPPHLQVGVFYDLTPPAEFLGLTFHRVRCEHRVLTHPNEYVVRGIPEGGMVTEDFVLRFTPQGKTIPRVSENQEGF